MKLHKIVIAALALTMALSACAEQAAPAVTETTAGSHREIPADNSGEKAESAAAEEITTSSGKTASGKIVTVGKDTAKAETPETEAEPAETAEAAESEVETEAVSEEAEAYNVFADMDGIIFGFMSGVGAWETTLEVAPDGSFKGLFYDMNMGETGEGYDNGTLYECSFTGRFSEPEQKDDLTWTTEVAALDFETEKEGSDRYIEDGMLHILTDPYGLSLGDSIEILLPGTPYKDLTEGFLSWMIWQIEEGKDLPEIAIYNTTNEYVFYPDHYAMGDVDSSSVPDVETGNGQEDTPTSIYESALNAYANQQMPDYYMMPYVQIGTFTPQKPYESVTEANLQGRWVNRYKEGGAEIEEILTINGDHGKIECYRDGEPTYAWNGEGTISIEDRSDRNVCPAFRITNEEGNVCTIYIRWVKDNAFYDGGFLNQWKRESPEDPADTYLYDTVTLDNLQGLWYSEYEDGAGIYMTLLNIDGEEGWIFETVDGRISSTWNGEGKVSLVMQDFMDDIWYPELLLDKKDGTKRSNIAGIYITDVESDRFYDAGFKRWYVKITPDYGKDLEYLWEPGFEVHEDGSAWIDGKNSILVIPTGEMNDDGSCLQWTIRVTNDEGTEETISHEVFGDTIYTPQAYEVVSEADVNFDDRMDLLLYCGTIGAAGVQIYDCYLNQGDRFVHCEGFTDIPDPDPDAASRQIIGHARDGANAYVEVYYTIRGTSAVLIDEIRYEYDEAAGDYIPKN